MSKRSSTKNPDDSLLRLRINYHRSCGAVYAARYLGRRPPGCTPGLLLVATHARYHYLSAARLRLTRFKELNPHLSHHWTRTPK